MCQVYPKEVVNIGINKAINISQAHLSELRKPKDTKT